jgi:hypothetical protein
MLNDPAADTALLDHLAAEFPSFTFWSEPAAGDGVRYGAQRRHSGLSPHTVLTTDVAELRAALGAGVAAGEAQPPDGPLR